MRFLRWLGLLKSPPARSSEDLRASFLAAALRMRRCDVVPTRDEFARMGELELEAWERACALVHQERAAALAAAIAQPLRATWLAARAQGDDEVLAAIADLEERALVEGAK